jgi:hypothetical protein
MFKNIRMLFLLSTCESSPCDVYRCLPHYPNQGTSECGYTEPAHGIWRQSKHNNVLSLCMNSHNTMLRTLTDKSWRLLCQQSVSFVFENLFYCQPLFFPSHLFVGFSYQCVFHFKIYEAKHTPYLGSGGKLRDFQSRETVKYDHEFSGTRNQEWLCWRDPAAIYPISVYNAQTYLHMHLKSSHCNTYSLRMMRKSFRRIQYLDNCGVVSCKRSYPI